MGLQTKYPMGFKPSTLWASNQVPYGLQTKYPMGLQTKYPMGLQTNSLLENCLYWNTICTLLQNPSREFGWNITPQ